LYDSTFNTETLGRMINAHDFHKYSSPSTPLNKNSEISAAVHLVSTGFNAPPLKSYALRGKTIYQPADLPTNLVLRKITSNIERVTRVKQQNRLDILRRISGLCKEGVPFCVHKIDIKSFYESIQRESLLQSLQGDLPSSPTTLKLLTSFFKSLTAQGITGLPRGLGISATLSEYLLRDFDRSVRSLQDVDFYARYVDDILVISRNIDHAKRLQCKIIELLPSGLSSNQKKTKYLIFPDTKSTSSDSKRFDFLGHSFLVPGLSGKIAKRVVKVDIAEQKIKKIKTRLIKSIQQYNKDLTFSELEKRIRILTSNYYFYDYKSERYRGSGIYHNYQLIDASSESLVHLDSFLRHALTSGKGKIFHTFKTSTSNHARSRLLKYSFQRSFEKRIHFSFKNDELNSLMRCWKYVI